ncbi:MAG: hypothetical protein WBJ68_13780 [Candidatus Dechloromonas phosphoritropha]
MRTDLFDPAYPVPACFVEDFRAPTLADFLGTLVAADLLLVAPDFLAGCAAARDVFVAPALVLETAFLDTGCVFFVAPALALETVFLDTGCVFFVSVAALVWPPKPRPSKAPTSTATFNPCFIDSLLPAPDGFYPSLANEIQKSTEIGR